MPGVKPYTAFCAITFKEFAEVMNKDEHADNKSNWFVGGGHARNKKKRNNVASIGYKRLLDIVKDKINQKVRGRSTGSFATVNPNVMKVMFHSFDESGDGDLSRDEFSSALRQKLGLMNISDKDMEDLMDHFDQDGDGTITYDEFIAKVLPPEFVHGGGGIMDFESDDPDFAGAFTKTEQLAALKKQIKRDLLSKAKNMREMFRRMGGAGDGEVDEYEFKAALRNNNIGIGHEDIMGRYVPVQRKKGDKGEQSVSRGQKVGELPPRQTADEATTIYWGVFYRPLQTHTKMTRNKPHNTVK